MSIRVIVNGAKGKMGALACQTVQGQSDMELVGQVTKEDNLAQVIKQTQADVVVELTRADSVYRNSATIISLGARPVIGATGLLASEIAQLTTFCEEQKLGGIVAPNFSIGAILMMKAAAMASAYFSEVEIIEAHHQHKLDAPSGTALKTADMIAEARVHSKNTLELKELVPGARGGTHQDISIHSIRLPGVLARQEVIFGSLGETLTLSHNTIDRSCFMPGILLSCRKVMGLETLVYGLEHLI